MLTLKELVTHYRGGKRWVAKQGENHSWEAFKSKREAVEWALNGRTEFRAVQAGAAVERITDQIKFLTGEDPIDIEALSGFTVEDLITLARVLEMSRAQNIGDRLRSARQHAGLTQEDLAKKLGVRAITISRWERGQQAPSKKTLKRLEEILGKTVGLR
jgi:DNA-binding XRE family transcriptional regulator